MSMNYSVIRHPGGKPYSATRLDSNTTVATVSNSRHGYNPLIKPDRDPLLVLTIKMFAITKTFTIMLISGRACNCSLNLSHAITFLKLS